MCLSKLQCVKIIEDLFWSVEKTLYFAEIVGFTFMVVILKYLPFKNK
jgi:hypothetical protein